MPRTYYVWGEIWADDRAKMLVRWQRIGGFRITAAAGQPVEELSKGSIRHTRADAPIRVDHIWGD